MPATMHQFLPMCLLWRWALISSTAYTVCCLLPRRLSFFFLSFFLQPACDDAPIVSNLAVMAMGSSMYFWPLDHFCFCACALSTATAISVLFFLQPVSVPPTILEAQRGRQEIKPGGDAPLPRQERLPRGCRHGEATPCIAVKP